MTKRSTHTILALGLVHSLPAALSAQHGPRSNVTLRGATDPPPDALTTPLLDEVHFTGDLPIGNAI